MPSGAKKRKAAKKKKENQSVNHKDPSSVGSAQSHGSDDVKHQDDKDSDVGEVSSPVSRDLDNHQSPLAGGEEEVIHEEKIVMNTQPDEGVKTEAVDKMSMAVEEVNVVRAEREVKIEDYSNKHDGSFEHEETTKRAHDRALSRSSSSSSSSSDDESHGIKNSQAVEDIAPVADSATVPDSSPGRKIETGDNVSIEDASSPVVENASVVLGKGSPLGEKVEVDIRSPDNAVAISPVTYMVDETGEKKQSSSGDNAAISTASTDASLEPKEEAIIQPIKKIATISDPKVCVSQTTDDQLIMSYNVPVIGENGAEHVEDSVVTEPVVRTAPRPVQATSWKSCCGLFEVFAGSGR